MSAKQLKKRLPSTNGRGVSSEKDPDVESIGQNVARLRKERGITQVELARILGVTQPVVSEYERGGIHLRGEQLAVLSKLLRVSVDEILGLKQESETRRGPRDTRIARMLRELEGLPRRDKDAVVRTIEAFLTARSSHT